METGELGRAWVRVQAVGKGRSILGESEMTGENGSLGVTGGEQFCLDSGDTSFFGMGGRQHEFPISHRVNVQKKNKKACAFSEEFFATY